MTAQNAHGVSFVKYWLIIHSLRAYGQHSDLIGCSVKEAGVKEPGFRRFADIQEGDKIAYYATGDHVVVGLFDVVSDIWHLTHDSHWKEDMVYNIRPVEMPPKGFYLDFKKVLFSGTVRFDLFPIKKRWGAYLRGKTCLELSEHDYLIIKKYLKNPEYLVKSTSLKIKTRKTRDTPHDSVLDSLMTIGEIFGFESVRKPNVNELRPEDQPFKAKGKTLDLAWHIFRLTWVPFEIQVHGSIPDLIYRLNLVHQWALRMVIVADSDFHDEIQEAAQIYPFAGKLVLLTPTEVEKATKDLSELRSLRQRIFL